MQVQSLGGDDPPGEGHGNPLSVGPCLENPMDRELGGLKFIGLQRVRHDWSALAHRPKYSHNNQLQATNMWSLKSIALAPAHIVAILEVKTHTFKNTKENGL